MILSSPFLSAPSVIADVLIFFAEEAESSPTLPILIVPSLQKDQLEL
jgi:hypothetical protein